MRKILLMLIILLVVVLGYTIVFKGIEIAGLKVSSVEQIGDANNKLDTNIENLNNLLNMQYPSRIEELKKASQNMQEAKEEYLNETNKSTNSQILEAMQEKTYRIEFLWVRLQTHAKDQEVVLKFEILPSSIGANKTNDLKFTVNGTYNDTIKFINALENDTDLNFKIESFKMQPTESGKFAELLGIDTSRLEGLGELGNLILESTFYTRNVGIDEDTLSKTITNADTANDSNSDSNSNSNDANATNDKAKSETDKTNTDEKSKEDKDVLDEIQDDFKNSGNQKSAKQVMQEN